MSKIWAAVALSCALLPGVVQAKASTAINVPENRELFTSAGDVLVKVNMRESLPNAFGGSDIFGRKRDRGFVELRFMGMAPDGRAIFRRRTVDIYSNETTMTRAQPRWGTATVDVHGNSARATGFSTGSDRATVEALPPDTIEIAMDLAKGRILTIEDRQVEIRSADEAGAKYVVTRRSQ